jgi:hypothetical protein
MKAAIALVAFLSMPALVFHATICVPDDYPTIQGAIDASVGGNNVEADHVNGSFVRGTARLKLSDKIDKIQYCHIAVGRQKGRTLGTCFNCFIEEEN